MDESLRALQRRLDADPLDPEPARMLARLHLRQGGLVIGRSVDAWIETLVAEKEAGALRTALNALGEAHPYAALAIPLMLERFSRGLLWREALAFIQARGRWSLPFLAEAMDSADYLVRARSVEALGALGPIAAPALELFSRAFEDEHAWVRHKAVQASGGLGAAGRPLLPCLQGALSSTDFREQVMAVHAIACIEGDGQALPALRRRLISEDPDLRAAARSVLMGLEDPFDDEGLRRLGVWSHSRDPLERFAALMILSEAAPDFGPIAAAFDDGFVNLAHVPLNPDLPLLAALLEDPDENVVLGALRQLIGLARDDQAALEALESFLNRPYRYAHYEALRALRSLGSRARPILTRLLGHPDEAVRRQAGCSLELMEG